MVDRMIELLTAPLDDRHPAPEFDQFARFSGSWDVEADFFDGDGSSTKTTAEWHFALILGGLALQDVLVFPALDRPVLTSSHRIGTSLRLFDSEAGLWKVVWVSPGSGTVYKLSGRMEGDRIVLNGDPHDGEPTQWVFEDITDDSFTWRGLVEREEEWKLIQLMYARRR